MTKKTEFRAENLTISIPSTEVCEKNCPYCISKMTEPVKVNEEIFSRNFMLAVEFAKRAGVMNVLITGKNEPLSDENFEMTYRVIEWVNTRRIPIELQTNGMFLHEDNWRTQIEALYDAGLNILAISVDSAAQITFLRMKIPDIRSEFPGLIIRVTINMSDMLGIYSSVMDLIEIFGITRTHQITFRILNVPTIVWPDGMHAA